MNLFRKDKKSKRLFTALQALFIVSGVFQGVAVILTIPLFNDLFLGHSENLLHWLSYIAISALICFVSHYVGVNIGNHMSVWEVCDNKTRALGDAIIKLPLGWFDLSSKGKVSKAISTDINTVSHYPPIVLPEVLTVLSSSAIIAVALLFISLKYALIIIVMALLMYYFWKKNSAALQSVEAENVRANQKMQSTIVEFAQLQPVLRASGALVAGWERLEVALSDDRQAALQTLRKKAENSFKYMFVANAGAILILVLSALELNVGAIDLYTFIGVSVALLRFANPLAGLIGYISELFNIQSALGRVDAIIGAERLPEASAETDLHQADEFGIVFKDVDFSYVTGTPVLKKVNLTIAPNAITALVGPSGSGKSTINKLIARFWDVDSGSIEINGQNIKNIKTEALMDLISMVFQEVYLFNTTIKENLRIANPLASDADIMAAAQKARLDEVVARLPNGWETNVGEAGSTLSGGEKQRVSIARAFLKNAPILLLDEITSALDGVNEAIIVQSLAELSKNKTVVVIAHRLSSIKNADEIVVLDDGRISACDSHQNLMRSSEKYQRLWRALLSGQSWQL